MKHLAWMVVALCACGGSSKPAAEPTPVANEAKAPEPVPAPSADPSAASAQADADRATAKADAARANVDAIQAELVANDAMVNLGVDAVANAQNQADRDAAKAKLEQVRKQRRDIESRLAAAKTESAKAERERGVKISPACMNNPLAAGC